MGTQQEDHLDAILRTLKLAQAQLRSLKRDYQADPGKEGEIEGVIIAIDLLIKKINALAS